MTGIVDLVDPVGGYLGITDETGLAIDLIVAEETVIRDGNVDVALNAELFGRRIMVTYDPSPDSLRAHRVELVRDTGLPSHIIEQLAASATEGEAEGTVIQTNLGATPGFISVQLDDGTRLPLNVVPGAGYVTGLASSTVPESLFGLIRIPSTCNISSEVARCPVKLPSRASSSIWT